MALCDQISAQINTVLTLSAKRRPLAQAKMAPEGAIIMSRIEGLHPIILYFPLQKWLSESSQSFLDISLAPRLLFPFDLSFHNH